MACVSRDLTTIIPVPSRNVAARFHTLYCRGTRGLATLRRWCNIFEKLWNNPPGLGENTPKPSVQVSESRSGANKSPEEDPLRPFFLR